MTDGSLILPGEAQFAVKKDRALIPGQVVTKKKPFLFRCPTCLKRMRFAERYESMCTGPSESRDEHEPTVMVFLSES